MIACCGDEAFVLGKSMNLCTHKSVYKACAKVCLITRCSSNTLAFYVMIYISYMHISIMHMIYMHIKYTYTFLYVHYKDLYFIVKIRTGHFFHQIIFFLRTCFIWRSCDCETFKIGRRKFCRENEMLRFVVNPLFRARTGRTENFLGCKS